MRSVLGVLGTARATALVLRRRVLLGGVYAATAALTWAVTLLNFSFAAGATSGGSGNGIGRTIAELEQPRGATAGLSVAVFGFGIALLCVAAAVCGGHWTTGRLRTVLIAQPRRVHYLAGVWLALVCFAAGAVLVSAVVSVGTSLVVASGHGVSDAAWVGAGGLAASLLAVMQAWLACVGYVTLGAALGLLLRAPVLAVAIGFGWSFIVESIVPQAAQGTFGWLPGQLLGAIAAGGTAAVPIGEALTRAALYVVVLAAPAVWTFRRRDVLV